MNEFCFEPGIAEQEIEGALQALSLSEAQNVPLFGSCAKEAGRHGRVLFANKAMLRLFGCTDLDSLEQRLFAAEDPGARRLAELSRSLPLDGAPRLERLRFFLGPASEAVTCLCRRLTRGDAAPLFVAAALGVRPSLLRPNLLRPNPLGANQTPQSAKQPSNTPEPSVSAVAAPVLSLEETRNGLKDRLAGKDVIRFLWRTDALDRIIEITPPLEQVVGAGAGNLVGRDFAEVSKRLNLDPEGQLERALARRQTWSGIEVLWPITGAAASVPVGLGGLPTYEGDRSFAGFRGFGVIHIDRIGPGEPYSQGLDPPLKKPVEEAGDSILATEEAVNANMMAGNVVLLRPPILPPKSIPPVKRDELPSPTGLPLGKLTSAEQSAFREIGFVLGAEREGKEAEPKAPTEVSGEFEKTEMVSLVSSEEAERPAKETASAESEPRHAPLDVQIGLAAEELRGNAPAILDRLGLGLLVSRQDVPIYANRSFLDLLGFADIDAFHAAGGITGIFEHSPVQAANDLVLVSQSGEKIIVDMRIQSLEWDGLPASLLSVRRQEGIDAKAALETELRRYEAESRELNAILDTATDGLALIDAEGRILALNRSGEALFGYDQNEVLGETFTKLIAVESQAKASDYFSGLKSDGVASLLNDGREVMGRARQGGTIPIFMTLGRIGTGQGQGQGERTDPKQKFCALFRDMTHWKKVERELEDARREAERASALKSDFLAKVSHEIRTPLNAILGFAEVIMDERFGPVGNERYKDYLKDIHASGAHVMSLVNDLLDLSKIESGKMDLDFASVDVNRVVAECVSIMQPQASRERVIMRLSLAQKLPHIMADERSLRQIVLNLLSNAVKFNEPGGQVIVATALTDAGHAVIRIRDTGMGMSEHDIETALEPFRQLATSRPTVGTGLGLPLTKALVEANRAVFTIKSKKQQGTLVEVAFPPARVLAG